MFSGAAAGMAFLTRPTTVLVLPALFAQLLQSHCRQPFVNNTEYRFLKNALRFSTTYLPFAGISLLYNHYRFGSIFETGYSLIASRLGLDFFSGTSLLTGLSGFLVSPGKGFFFYSPVAILFFFSIKSFYKRHPGIAVAFTLLMSSYLIFLSKNIYWHGDWTWGPRYLLAITPFFIIPLAEIIDSPLWRKKVLRFSFYLIFLVSAVIQMAAVTVDCTKYFNNLKYISNVEFVISTGEGVQPISEPPTETYFKWSRSPILAQFRYIFEIGQNLNSFKLNTSYKSSPVLEQLKASPRLNLYDYWWIYIFFINKKQNVIFLVSAILFLSIYSGLKLYRWSRSDE